MNKFKFGDRVRHPELGVCVICMIAGRGDEKYIRIMNNDGKDLILSHRSIFLNTNISILELIPQFAWISVNDALPEKDGVYLTYAQSAEYTGIDLTSFTDGKFRENLALNEVVTHWQTLPEPPKTQG